MAGLRLRSPRLEDGPAMWQLVRESSLDDNSPYAYLLLAHAFADTCVVAEAATPEAGLAGFVSAFRPPERPQTLFVWQIGVSPQARGRGLGTHLIAAALRRKTCADVRFVEATVTPSNAASLALFRGLADKLGTDCSERLGFPATLFPGDGHEEERLLRIGPIGSSALDALTPTLE